MTYRFTYAFIPSSELVMVRPITISFGNPFYSSHNPSGADASRSQGSGTAAPAASASEPETPPVPQASAASSTQGTARLGGRARQILNTKFLPHEPALRYRLENDSDWPGVANAICDDWLGDARHRKEQLASQESSIDTSRMMALLYEYKHHQALIRGNEALLLANIKKPRWFRRVREPGLLRATYHKEILLAFLHAVGEKDAEAVLKSFKKTGTGALHRQHVVAGSTLANMLGAAQLIVPDLVAKVVLSVARTVIVLVTSTAIVASGRRRLHNAGTEDVFPLGRADAAPAAKRAPNVMQASWSVMGQLRGLDKDLQELKTLLTELGQPETEPHREDNDGAAAAHQSTQRIDMLLLLSAKISHKLHIMEKYRSASENAKVEWQGNKYNLITGSVGLLSTLTASGISILAPVVIASTTAGAVLAAATAVAVLAYITYQLSNGPEKDGEAKAKRAIIALAKLSDVIDPGGKKDALQQAQAYEAYLQALNKKGADREAAEGELLNQLRDIAQARLAAAGDADEDTRSSAPSDPTGSGDSETALPDEVNWRCYLQYHQARQAIENDGERQADQTEELASLDRQFFESHASKLANKPLIDGWKKPLTIRMNATGRIVAGQTASSMKQCVELHRSLKRDTTHQSSEGGRRTFSTPPSIHRLMENRHARQRTQLQEKLQTAQDDLRRHLKNLVYFALAEHLLKEAADEMPSGQEPGLRSSQLQLAKAALAKLDDSSVRMVFCGDGMQQVKAMLASKTEMGDVERYTLLNTGSNAAATLVGIGVQAGDLQITADKMDGRYSGPMFNDYKLLNHMQAATMPSAPLSTGDRTAIQNREINPLRALITPEDDVSDAPSALTMILPAFKTTEGDGEAETGNTEFETQLDAQIGRIVEAMDERNFIPRSLRLHFDVQAESGPSSSTHPHREMALGIDLSNSRALHDMYFDHANTTRKARYAAGAAGLGAKQSAIVFAGVPMQSVAQFVLRRSRDTRNAAKKELEKVKTLLQNRRPVSRPPATGNPASDAAPPATSADQHGQPLSHPDFTLPVLENTSALWSQSSLDDFLNKHGL